MATRVIGFSLVLAVLLCAGCRDAPASAEAKKSDTPKQALLTLLHAMHDADAAKVAAACKITEEQRPIIEAGAAYTRAVYVFRDAMIAAYGREAWDIFQDPARRPGDHDTTFILITDRELTKAEKTVFDQDANSATCVMPTGGGKVKLVKTDKGWLVDGSTFVPATQTPAELKKMLDSLTATVRKYQPAIGKPNISPSDIDYELGREVDFLVSGIPDSSRHRFNIEKL